MKYEDIASMLYEGYFSGPYPRPSRVELGVLLCKYLKRRSEAVQDDDDDEYKNTPVQYGKSLGVLFGIPIDVPECADPWSWRYLDAEGHVINEGTVTKGEAS